MLHTHSKTLPSMAPDGFWHSLLVPRRLRMLYERSRLREDAPLWRAGLEALRVTYAVDAAPNAAIPARGATVVVANHPFGILDGAVVLDYVHSQRPDVRVLTNYQLALLPDLQHICIPIDPYDRRTNRAMNRDGLRQAARWLQNGGVLVVFPAGEVATWNARGVVVDGPWKTTATRLIARSGATVVPFYVAGGNSKLFHMAGWVHPAFRTMRLGREFLNKEGARVQLVLGHTLAAETLALHPAEQATESLRARTLLLRWRRAEKVQTTSAVPRALAVPVARPLQPAALERELKALPAHARLHVDKHFEVYLTDALSAPLTLLEIGRVREATFRGAGEGTGRDRDIDVFDASYQQLVLWHPASKSIAGGYRLARTDLIVEERGVAGLYSHEGFAYESAFLNALHGAWEVGRSFIARAHQRCYGALLALWKGLASHVYQPGSPPRLMGAVSISNDYHPVSRALMAAYIQRHHFASELAAHVRGRVPWVSEHAPEVAQVLYTVRSLNELSRVVAQVEPNGRGVPVLVRQYLRLGGRAVAFSVDRAFGNTLDALIYVDLRKAPRRVLQRYVTRHAAHHQHLGAGRPAAQQRAEG